jgi:hypothetical protein
MRMGSLPWLPLRLRTQHLVGDAFVAGIELPGSPFLLHRDQRDSVAADEPDAVPRPARQMLSTTTLRPSGRSSTWRRTRQGRSEGLRRSGH